MKLQSPLPISDIMFGNVLMNGAYIGSKTLEDVETLAKSAAGAIVIGSISIKPRAANPGQGYWRHKERFYSLNSYGLPNGGLPYFKEHLPRMVEVAHAHRKPLVANVVGFSKEDFEVLIKLAQDAGADMVELNFGCPNVWDDGQQKSIISYHPSLMKEILDYIANLKPTIKLCVKISPLPPDLLHEVADVIGKSGAVEAVTATNSYPNASVSSGTAAGSTQTITLAGLSGRA